ncbi:MAG: condensin subunit MukF [Polyangiales bacterium]
MSSPARSNEQILSLIAEQQLSLQLNTLQLGFLVALHLQGRSGHATSFSEQQLEDVFIQASLLLAPEADQRKRRATHAIAHLREQRLLARVDGQGVVRTGEFTLSRLALGIVEFFLEDEVLTRDSLVVLTSSLRVALVSVRESARAGAFHDGVIGPLRVTVAELVSGIERRQRGLDLQQEDFRAEIRRLLEEDWFSALSRCQSLLESTSATLQELNQVLLRDTAGLLSLLQDIAELAIAAGEPDAEVAAAQLMDQIDRIAAWGAARQRAFSDYFQYVHRYLRDVVRLDPARALTQRLRDQLAGHGAKFALTYAFAPPLRLLRTVTALPERPAVVRPRATREKELAADSGEDRDAVLRAKVQGALDDGATALSSVTSAVTEALPAPERFLEAGRVAHSVAQLARATSAVEREWVSAGDGLVIEDWSLRVLKPGAADE